MIKVILHLCADLGSDSRYYQLDDNYEVIMIGEKIGVENYHPPKNVHGVIANPVCTEFSTAKGFDHYGDLESGMFLVNHCLRIIKECNPKWWVMENPAKGRLKEVYRPFNHKYQPWEYGSPWTKETALWGNFVMPKAIYQKWDDVPKNDKLYIRPTRSKPSLAIMHKSAKEIIPEFEWAKDLINDDMSLRSMCSQGFAKAFFEANP